jgi:hypothetical protein
MFDLLDSITRELDVRRVQYALVGAGALAVHGVLRASDDLDLLVTDRAVLSSGAWDELASHGVGVEVRLGDDEDPLAGVIRFTGASSSSVTVDVVVGKHAWQADVLARAERRRITSTLELPVVTASDLILLKLFAGAPRDLRDVEEILDSENGSAVEPAVTREIDRLPREAREAWHGISLKRGPPR